jgi:hypothetical protein
MGGALTAQVAWKLSGSPRIVDFELLMQATPEMFDARARRGDVPPCMSAVVCCDVTGSWVVTITRTEADGGGYRAYALPEHKEMANIWGNSWITGGDGADAPLHIVSLEAAKAAVRGWAKLRGLVDLDGSLMNGYSYVDVKE